ncbi:MAG: amidohydrolase family protein [Verrucomicrobiota bacterium]|nr:amidohydrolase family protein [Verrucomicrobiota bacterium]
MSEVIDFHTHNFPDVLAPRAIESMARKLRGSLVPFGDGTVATQLRDMAAAGVDKAVVCPVATKPAQFQTILDRAKAVRDGEFGEEAANRLVQLCSVHPADPDFEGHIGQVAAAGFKGVKVHPYYQGFSLGDPKVVPYFRAVRDAGLFVIAHCGIDLGFVEAPMVCGPAQIASLLKAVPGLKFVAAHIGGCGGNPPHATDALLEFENCFLDTAVVNVCDDDAECRRVMSEWPAERLLFATDYFWRDERFVAGWVRQCRPDPAEQELVFSENAHRLLGL